MRTQTIAFFLAAALCSPAIAQAPFRLRDTNASVPVSLGGGAAAIFTQIGSIVLFQAQDLAHGTELWKTDGTAAGTVVVKDIKPGFNSGRGGVNAPQIVVLNGFAYFDADDGLTGTELWKTDGTEAGTTEVVDICPGGCSSNPSNLVASGGNLYFVAQPSSFEYRLWRTDGTTAGTQLVTGAPALFFSGFSLADFNGVLFFGANSALWQVNGNTASVFASYASDPVGLTAANNRMFFSTDSVPAHATYVTDGVSAPVKLTDHSAGGGLGQQRFIAAGSLTFFNMTDGGGPGTGTLWLTDGTPGGTHAVSDVATGPAFTLDWFGASALGSFLYFSGFDGSTHTVWRTDGTTVGPFVPECDGAIKHPIGFTTLNGSLYYHCGGTNDAPLDLWVSDGTVAGTTKLTTTGTLWGATVAFNGGVIFSAWNGYNGWDPWFTNGTPGTTASIKQINPTSTSSEAVGYAATTAGSAAFSALSEAGKLLWFSDGTTAGTHNVINDAGEAYANAGTPIQVSGATYFAASTTANGTELWKSDGTAAGTVMLKDICAGACSSNPSNLTNINGALYFAANDGINGTELWKSDGTESGTTLVADVFPGSGSSISGSPLITAAGGYVYFAANDGSSGKELWRTDGTAVGTMRVIDMTPGSGSTTLSAFSAVGSDLYFRAGNQVWKTDGSSSALIQSFSGSYFNQGRAANANGIAVFRGADEFEVWRSDGTPAGTQVLVDANFVSYSNVQSATENDNAFVLFNGVLFFGFNDGIHGRELWTTDGNSAALFADICPGACGASIGALTVVGNKLFFQANDGTGGEELWVTDGTPGNTHQVSDIEPGSGASRPLYLTASGHLLYFTAFTTSNGNDPYVACSEPVTHYLMSASGKVGAGAAVPVNVTAVDGSGQIVPCYTGSAVLTSDDANATLPPAQQFTAGEPAQTIPIVLNTPGTHTITATDTVSNTIVGTTTVEVIQPLPAPLITATFDVVNNHVTIAFNDTAGAQNVVILRSNDNNHWSHVATVASSSGTADDASPAANTTWLYVAHYLDASDIAGQDSNVDPATTVPDIPLSGDVAIQLAHITSTRDAIDMFRTTVGLGNAAYSHATIAAGDPVSAIDWQEMRDRLDEARALVTHITPPSAYGDPPITSGTPIKLEHLTDLWLRMQ